MFLASKYAGRSPLKATDANSKRQPHLEQQQGHQSGSVSRKLLLESGGKRKAPLQERLDLQPEQKKIKVERGRSIEGAIQVSRHTPPLKNADGHQQTSHKQQSNVTPNELLEWQNNWRKIMRRDSKIYFDITDEADTNKHSRSKLDKKKDLLRKGFSFLGAEITQFFDSSVTIVITRRSIDRIGSLPEADILSRARKDYMKIWGYEKAARFLKNLEVDLENLEKSKNASLVSPTLSNLLQNEKLYGPTDRDPRTRRNDIHYFKYSYVYMYDFWQTWAPIITLEWKPQELVDSNNLPYPVLKMGSFGRCPFVGDGSCDETTYKRVCKRYNRDKSNKQYALKLRYLYQFGAEPAVTQEDSQILLFIPHTCMDSEQSFLKWQKKLSSSTKKDSKALPTKNEDQLEKEVHDKLEARPSPVIDWREPQKISPAQRVPLLASRQVVPSLLRHETEEFPDDLCNPKLRTRFPQEIKASGVHQSNDVATSFGNGLGPTRASVTNKNMKSLSRLVVDRRLGTTMPMSSNAHSTGSSKVTAATASLVPAPLAPVKSNNDDIMQAKKVSNSYEGNKSVPETQTRSFSLLDNTPKVERQVSMPNVKSSAMAVKETATNTTTTVADVAATATAAVANPKLNGKTAVNQARHNPAKNSGYCENCRVKFDSLDQHILTERHQSFAQNDYNFEMIDTLIDKLKFQF